MDYRSLRFFSKSWMVASLCGLGALSLEHASAQNLNGSRLSGVPIRQIQPSVPNTRAYSGNVYSPQNSQAYPSSDLGIYSNAITEVGQPAFASDQIELVAAADTSRQSQQDALNSIPWQELNGEGKRKIQEIVDSPSLYRRLPKYKISCDPQFHIFSLRNPETIVNMWQVFGVTTMGLRRTGPYNFVGNDGAGTDCTAELIYGDNQRHIYVGSGTYEGPVFKRKITGRCVAILKTDATLGESQVELTDQLDIFIKIDNLGADLITKTLHPLVGRTADHNFRETLVFLQAFSDSAVQDPQRVSYLGDKLQQVEPSVQSQFQQVVSTIGVRKQQYMEQQSVVRQSQAASYTQK